MLREFIIELAGGAGCASASLGGIAHQYTGHRVSTQHQPAPRITLASSGDCGFAPAGFPRFSRAPNSAAIAAP
jgi:hypothetical protein